MARTAAAMLTRALQNQHQNATIAAATNFNLEAQLEQIDQDQTQTHTEPEHIIPLVTRKKRGRPSGKTATAGKNTGLSGTGPKKRKVLAIQNSPRVRKSSTSRTTQNSRRTIPQNQSRATQVPKPPSRRATTVTTDGEAEAQKTETSRASSSRRGATSPRNEARTADFHDPQRSLP